MALQKKHRTIYLAARTLAISETRLSRIIAERVAITPDERSRIERDLADVGVPLKGLFQSGGAS
ncbi:MAG TPA: hypothetical protein VGH28_28275 [Polyangiaceae bacterium]